jgi:hypothetical protein
MLVISVEIIRFPLSRNIGARMDILRIRANKIGHNGCSEENGR